MKLGILNTSILTADGEFILETITLTEALRLTQSNEILSAIGHESTAQILTELLKIEIPVNRIMFQQEVRQRALIFKLNGRPPEGKILTKQEILDIGFEFKILTLGLNEL